MEPRHFRGYNRALFTDLMNLSGTFNVLKLIHNPSLCLSQASISNFNHLPIPLSTAFVSRHGGKVDIRAVVLDKDNCFAKPNENAVHKPYEVGDLSFSIAESHHDFKVSPGVILYIGLSISSWGSSKLALVSQIPTTLQAVK